MNALAWAVVFLALAAGPTVALGGDRILVDLLPDFVGWLLLARGASRLPGGRRLAALAYGVAIVAVPFTIQPFVDPARWTALPVWVRAGTGIWAALKILELAAVWRVCGLVGSLAALDAARPRAAWTAAALLPLVATAAGSFAATIASIAAGLVAVAIVFRFFRRADIQLPDAQPARAMVGALGLALAAYAFALGAYHREWTGRRERMPHSADAVRRPFVEGVVSGDLERAWEGTSASFRRRVGREEFERRARAFVEFRNDPRVRLVGSGSSGGYDGSDSYDVYVQEGGVAMRLRISIRREPDSLFRLEPPRLAVEEFSLEEEPQR